MNNVLNNARVHFNIPYYSTGIYFLKVTSCLKTDVKKVAHLYLVRVDTQIGKLIYKIMEFFTETFILEVNDGSNVKKLYQYVLTKRNLVSFARKEKQFLDKKEPTDAWINDVIRIFREGHIKSLRNLMALIQPDLKLKGRCGGNLL